VPEPPLDEPGLVRPVYSPPSDNLPPKCTTHTVRLVDGVYTAFRADANGAPIANSALYAAPSVSDYYRDLSELSKIVSNGDFSSFAYRRLQLFQARFQLHQMLNGEEEKVIQKTVPHRDFYNVRKVDTHVHHSSAMNQKHLLRFIKKKLKTEPDVIVIHRNGVDLTLQGVFDSLKLTAYDLSVDTLDVHADNNTFHRFDRFNLKYNPIGESRLREIFLKTDNLIRGRYLAELTHELFDDLTQAKYQYAEYRVSIYGRTRNDFRKLARWVCEHRLFHENVRWLIQIPRLWHAFKEAKTAGLESFQDMIDNIFEPLFAVTLDPSVDPMLSRFLEAVVGFDCVDDESQPEHRFMQRFSTPSDWVSDKNPPYTYYTFYLQQNLRSLNVLRAARGMSLIQFRPHAGEAGDREHLISAYMCANSINHGIELLNCPPLEYLFYLSQIGIAMSPLSNNALFCDYHKNPCYKYFQRGLNISLSTDDPLQFHYTREPLIEEYSIAAQVWKLSTVDQMEIARNSVIQSGFGHEFKLHWLGPYQRLPSAIGNDLEKTNIPNMRVQYRYEQLAGEWHYVVKCLQGAPNAKELDARVLMQSYEAVTRYGGGATPVTVTTAAAPAATAAAAATTTTATVSGLSIPMPLGLSSRNSSTRADRPKTPRD
jgi:AMP deaminase